MTETGWIVRDVETGEPIGIGDMPTTAVADARRRGYTRGRSRPALSDAEWTEARTALAEADEAAMQWMDQWKLLRQRDRDAIPDTLGPPLVFSDKMATAEERQKCGHNVGEDETGPHSRAVTSRLRMSCAGWTTVPSAAEFHDAIHRPAGTDRETAILLTWFHEAQMIEQLDAYLEDAYSWRQLVRALHRVGLTFGLGAERINRFAERRPTPRQARTGEA